MKKNITVKEVALKAGVSTATVSRALNTNTSDLVKISTREKINKICNRLNYVPQKAGRDLRKQKSGTIGLLVNFQQNIFSGYLQEILKGITLGLSEIGYDLKLISSERFLSIHNILNNYGVDGIIMTHAYTETFPNLFKEIKNRKNKFPLVIINDYCQRLKTNHVYSDGFCGMKKITEILVDIGYTNFFYIGGSEASPDAATRKRAFLETLKIRKKYFNKNDIENGHFSEKGGYLAAKKKIEKEPSFKGVFVCANDAMALGALRALGEKKIKCPENIGVTGYDGIFMSQFSNPPLSTIEIPLSDMGKEAVMLLYNILDKGRKNTIVKKFNFNIKLRQSTLNTLKNFL